MKLFDMKRPPIKASLNPKTIGKEQNAYSYEHKITLDDAALSKLGLDTPKVGDKFHVMAHGTVTDVSQDSSADGRKSRRVGIQLRKMGAHALKKGSALGAVEQGISDADGG